MCLRSEIHSGGAKVTLHLGLPAPREARHSLPCASQCPVPAFAFPWPQAAVAAQGWVYPAVPLALGGSVGRDWRGALQRGPISPDPANQHLNLDILAISVAANNILTASLCRMDAHDVTSVTTSPFWHMWLPAGQQPQHWVSSWEDMMRREN